jgi:hypothetical protein
LGDYDLLFFDGIDTSGVEHSAGYVVKGGTPVGAVCDGLTFRPIGANSTFPPTNSSGTPNHFHLTMALDDGSEVEADVYQTYLQIDESEYLRWMGPMNGTIGGVSLSGSALWEQLSFAA